MKSTMHPLEHRTDEASYFAKQGEHGKAAYRRAAEACTGAVPTWAQRRTPGRKKKLPYAATRLGGPADSFHAVASGDTGH